MTIINADYSLHLIFGGTDAWQKAKQLITENDRVLFLQDSVYLLQVDLNLINEFVYARQLDVSARNITPVNPIEVIDDEQWLELTEKATNIISW